MVGCGPVRGGVGDRGAKRLTGMWWGALTGRAVIGVEMVGWGQEKRAGFDPRPNMVARLSCSVAVRVDLALSFPLLHQARLPILWLYVL